MKARSFAGSLLGASAIANLIFIEQWHELLRVRDPGYSYFVTNLTPANYIALFTNIALLGALGVALMRIASTSRYRPARFVSVMFLLVGAAYAFNAVRRETISALGATPVSSSMVMAAIAVAGIVCLLFVAGWPGTRSGALARLSRVFRAVAILSIPFLLLTAGDALLVLFRADLSMFRPEPAIQAAAKAPEIHRVVIAIFDEADYRLMFEDRPRDLSLPNFDRLRRESIFATNAVPPAGHTELSIPSYLTSKHVVAAVPASARDVRLTFAEAPQTPQLLSNVKTLFAQAHLLGARSGVVGWSQPYCRFRSQYLTECRARGGSTPPTTFVRAMLWQLGEALTVGPFLDREYGIGLPYHSRDYLELIKAASDLIAEPGLDLVWIHLPVPHEPRIIDRRTLRFVGPERHARGAYADNLKLADIALGQLRQTAESSGLWNGTGVIVTSDHAYRLSARDDGKTDPRIPFMIKPACDFRPREVTDRLDTVILGDLALELMRSGCLSMSGRALLN